jgi:hypothetical protein
MDQESEGTNLVIFVVGGVVLLLLLLLGGAAFFWFMSVEAMPAAEMPVMEPAKVEVHEEGPILVGPEPVEEAIRPKVAPLNKQPPNEEETLPAERKDKKQPPPPQK